MRDILGKYFRRDLGDVGHGVPKKNWVQLALAAASLAANAFGTWRSKREEEKAEKKEAASHNRQQAYWTRKANESYVDTAAGQNMLRQAKEYADKNWKKAQGAAAVGGGTDAATAQAKEAGNKVVSNTLANMSAQDTARQDAAGRAMMQEDQNYANKQAADLRQHGANIANAASAMGNAAAAIGAGLESQSTTTNGTTPSGTTPTTATPTETSTAKAVGDAPKSPNVGYDSNGSRYYKDGATVYKDGTGVGIYAPDFNKRYDDDQA